MADNYKGIYSPKTLIGKYAYEKAGPKRTQLDAVLGKYPDDKEEVREKMNKAMFEADDEVRRETKGATGNESMVMEKYRRDQDEKRRETRGMKSGGKVKSASARADGCAQRGKTRGKMI